MEKIIENAKEEMKFTIDKCDNYLREVVNQVRKVLSLYSNFKFEPQISKLKVELCKKIEDYNKEKSRVQLPYPKSARFPGSIKRVCKSKADEC